MANNPFNQSEDSSFEQGLSIKKPVKAVGSVVSNQAAQTTREFVAQLYGVKDDKQGDLKSDQSQNSPKASSSSPANQQQVSSNYPGIQTPEEQARYQALQKQLRGDGKSDEEIKAQSAHNQNYFRPTIGSVEDEVLREARKREQREAERNKKAEEEEMQKKQDQADKAQAPAVATGKSRNRMGQPPGKKPKTDMGLEMAKNKAEMFRGTSG
jgi:hypothetical protein